MKNDQEILTKINLRIESEADPVGFLISVVNGEEIDGERPTLAQRISAATLLAKKLDGIGDSEDGEAASKYVIIEMPTNNRD